MTVREYVFPSALSVQERNLSDNLFSPSLEKVAGRLGRSRLLTGPCGLAFKPSRTTPHVVLPAYKKTLSGLCCAQERNLSNNFFSPSLEKVAGRLARSRLLTGPCGLAFKSSRTTPHVVLPAAQKQTLSGLFFCAQERT